MYISISGGTDNTYETVVNDHTTRISFFETKVVSGWQIIEVDLTAYDNYTGDPEAAPTCLFIWGSGPMTYTLHSVYAE